MYFGVVAVGRKKFEYNPVKEVGSIKKMLKAASDEAGDKIAYKFRENKEIREVTFREFRNTTLYLGTALYDMGISNKHIAMLGENSYDWICVYLTVLQSDGVMVPIDKELSAEPMSNVLNDSDAEVIFYTKTFDKFIEENRDKFPKIKIFISIDAVENSEKALSFKKLIQKGKELYEGGERGFENIESDQMKMKMLVYTSGTTGIAKGVMLSEHNLVSIVYHGIRVSTLYGTGLSVLPYNHTYEAVPGILVYIHMHLTLCINENLKTVLKNLQTYKPYNVYLVPAFLEVFYRKIWSTAQKEGKEKALRVLIRLSNGLRKIGIDLRKQLFKSVTSAFGGNLRKIVVGGAPLRRELGEFFDSIGISVINGYGITECSPLVSVNNDEINDYETVGFPLPCCEVRIADADKDGIGEICVKGDIVMLGYYKQPELTAEVLSPDGWFRTGDYGRINELGQIIITGRKKNIIILDNGKNIFPEEIENCIQKIPYVGEVVVYGVKDERGNDIGLACQVYLSEEKMTELGIDDGAARIKTDIAEACRHLPAYKHIGRIILRDREFEKTTTAKIKRDKIDTTL